MKAIKSNKFPLLVGFIFSIALSFVVLRRALFAPGLMGFGDLAFNFDISAVHESISHSWTQCGSAPNANRAFGFPLIALSFLFNDSGTFVKFLYFLIFTLISSISFYTAFFYLKSRVSRPLLAYLGAIIASLVYTINPFTINQIPVFQALFAYAFLPLLFYFVPIAMRQVTFKGVLKYAIILSLIMALTAIWYYTLFFGAFLLLFFGFADLIHRTVTERDRLTTYLPYNLLLTVLVVFFFGLLFAYYLLPFRIGWSPSVEEQRLYITNPDILAGWSESLEFDDIFRMFGHELVSGRLDCSGIFEGIWTIAIWTIPLLAFSAIILKPKNKDVIVLAILATIGISISKGAIEPFANWYLWLFYKFEGLFTSAGLHGPERARSLITLPYAFLCAIGFIEIFSRLGINGSWRRSLLPIIPCIIVSALIGITAFPFLSGDLGSALRPWQMPEPFNQTNQWLETQEGIYKVMWLPDSEAVEWNPHKDVHHEQLSVNLTHLPGRFTSKEAGNLISERCLEGDKYYHYINRLLLSDMGGNYFGNLLSALNCKYIVYHDDTLDKEQFKKTILDNLSTQDDISLAFASDYVYVFENNNVLPYVSAQDKSILTIGGLGALKLLTELDESIPSERSFTFLEQNPGQAASFESQLQFSDFILFYGDKDFDDLILSSLDSQYYLPALKYWGDDYKSPWERDFFYSSIWPANLPWQQVTAFDFDLNLGMTYTEEPDAELKFTLNTNDDNYELWIRNLLSPGGGGLEVYVDGDKMPEQINSYSEVLQGFKWQKIGSMDFSQGEHEITIRTIDGWEAINTIAVVPEETLELHKEKIAQSLDDYNIGSIYATDYSLMSKYAENTPLKRVMELDISEEQEYVVAVSGKGWFSLQIDSNNPYNFNTEDMEWVYSDPLALSEGEHQIIIKGSKIQDMVIYPVYNEFQTLEELLDTEIKGTIIDDPVINTTKAVIEIEITEPCILSFGESYHSQWIATDEEGNVLPKVALNSVINGFLLETPGEHTIHINFAPEKYFVAGNIISITAFMILIVMLILIIYSERRRVEPPEEKLPENNA